MGSTDAVKPHAVFIPYPAQGHVTPMMQLAKLIHSRGSHVTFVNTEFNHRRLLRSKGLDSLEGLHDFRFETIPDGLPPSDKDATQEIPPLCESTRKNCLQPLVDLVLKLNSTSDVPNVNLIVSDGVMSFGVKAGEILGIPEVQFWTASACGFMGYIHSSELIKRGLTPLKDESYLSNGYLETPIDWIPGMRNIRLKDLPSFIRTTDPDDIMLHFMGEQAQNCLKASAIIYNTFDELEQEVLDAISSMYPNIYTIGPLPLLAQQLPETELNSVHSNLWKEDPCCLDWLDKRESKSVVYVNFGSITVMTNDHLREFAWGLANSNHPFLWILRADAVMGDSASIPKEFFEVTKDRGMIASWCPQDKVLSHPSIGGFLTHSGWNSTLETICAGVPVICWPFFCEQQTNCRYVCTSWEFGMEINNDVKREEIEELVKELIGGAKGMKLRSNALKWKEKAEVATRQGGSSYRNFERVINEVIYRKGINNLPF
ncbi:7-deoxyloganetin glucosyltransferase [Ranunculus cassubicifolius]